MSSSTPHKRSSSHAHQANGHTAHNQHNTDTNINNNNNNNTHVQQIAIDTWPFFELTLTNSSDPREENLQKVQAFKEDLAEKAEKIIRDVMPAKIYQLDLLFKQTTSEMLKSGNVPPLLRTSAFTIHDLEGIHVPLLQSEVDALVYICIYVYIYIYMCIYMYAYVCMHMYVCICM